MACAPHSAYAWRLETGEVTTNNTAVNATFTSVAFQSVFDVTPIVVVMPSEGATGPSTLRIKNVSITGFDVTTVEAPGSDGTNEGMDIHYVAMEPGVHMMPDGEIVAAGINPTTTWQSKLISPTGWDTVNFDATLSASASVVATIQTMNSEPSFLPSAPSSPFLSVAMLSPSATSIQMALERSEVSTGTVVSEDIGWIAFPAGANGSFLDAFGTSYGWDARTTSSPFTGWQNGCFARTFSDTSWSNARVFANKNTRNGVDGGWVRRCSITGTTIGLAIDEDFTTDNERAHTTENANILAFSGSFHLEFLGVVEAQKTLSMAEDTYALPSSIVTYKLSAQSVGNIPIDTDVIVLVDNLPPNVALKVTDIDAVGMGPVKFNDGAVSSDLTYSFIGLSSLTDDVDFSDDDADTFEYVPIPDGYGADANITHIRISPKGKFAAQSATQTPSFDIEFDVVIQ